MDFLFFNLFIVFATVALSPIASGKSGLCSVLIDWIQSIKAQKYMFVVQLYYIIKLIFF